MAIAHGAPDPAATPTGSTHDRFGQVEARGIDRIPEGERHGDPRELFKVWAGSNTTYLSLLVGGMLTLLGLGMWQALAAVLLGNLFWIPVGILAISGPASGTPSSIITRAMFGVRGNRGYVALASWPAYIAYEAVNLSLGALAAFALIDLGGISDNRPTEILIVVAISAITLTVSVYGHATIVKLSGYFTAVLAVVMVVLGGFVVAKADFHYTVDPATAPTGTAFWAAFLSGVAIVAANPVAWGISADYARYLPADSSKTRVAAFTALGGFVPSVLLGVIGALAGTVVDMTDPQSSLRNVVPGWFYPVFLVVVVLGSMTNNILTMYSSGLALQAIGFPIRRSLSVFIDGALGVALACYALFIADFTDTLSSILQLTVAVLGPTMAIYVVDILARRNAYDGIALHDASPGGTFWYHGGVNIAGAVALLAGTVSAALCINSTEFTGPVAEWLGGADTSLIVGPAVASALYAVLVKRLYGGFSRNPAPARPAPADRTVV
ncbi:purine-cytosine permease family protein [Embleya sp. MST-111070]|uniref:purine-cytosine permease family protein n=1 Tax=Embleya sp. MST-111070 TaxID=3398231 RepID=UPI003F73A4A4